MCLPCEESISSRHQGRSKGRWRPNLADLSFEAEAPWLGGRMPDSGSREPRFESYTYDGAVDGDTLWRQQIKILVIVLGNKL